ncbi:Hypothetical protein SCF082_LOCUS41836, partial [Durusdinium trenchii]
RRFGGLNPAYQKRTVRCMSLEEQPLLAWRCEHLVKPKAFRRCHCGVLSCKPDCQPGTDLDNDDEPDSNTEIGEERDSDFECVGCFPLGPGEELVAPPAVAADETCIDWAPSNAPCRSGMPFYRVRMTSGAMSAETCFEFCLGAGLDLFALVQGEECRCGASRLNKGVWGEKSAPPGHLQLPAPLSSCLTDQACPVRVYRWLGPFISGGSVPEHLLMLNAGNTIYVDSIVHGKHISEEQEEDGQPDSQEGAFLQDAKRQVEDPRWDRPCDDADGCQAGRPWIERTGVAPEGMVPQWEEYVMVRYKFDVDVDDTRKEAFRAAAAEWRLHTCVAVVEDENAAYPYILVGIYNTGSCWANLGRPSSYGKINLGWCKNMNHKGSMVHEIGHGNLADEACRITQTLFDISS